MMKEIMDDHGYPHDQMYQHFFKYSCSLRILSSSWPNDTRETQMLLAERLLKELIRDYDKHYHAENLSYNIHILLHLVDFCR